MKICMARERSVVGPSPSGVAEGFLDTSVTTNGPAAGSPKTKNFAKRPYNDAGSAGGLARMRRITSQAAAVSKK